MGQTEIKQVALGTQHSLFLDSQGVVYSCGDNKQVLPGIPGLKFHTPLHNSPASKFSMLLCRPHTWLLKTGSFLQRKKFLWDAPSPIPCVEPWGFAVRGLLFSGAMWVRGKAGGHCQAAKAGVGPHDECRQSAAHECKGAPGNPQLRTPGSCWQPPSRAHHPSDAAAADHGQEAPQHAVQPGLPALRSG